MDLRNKIPHRLRHSRSYPAQSLSGANSPFWEDSARGESPFSPIPAPPPPPNRNGGFEFLVCRGTNRHMLTPLPPQNYPSSMKNQTPTSESFGLSKGLGATSLLIGGGALTQFSENSPSGQNALNGILFLGLGIQLLIQGIRSLKCVGVLLVTWGSVHFITGISILIAWASDPTATKFSDPAAGKFMGVGAIWIIWGLSLVKLNSRARSLWWALVIIPQAGLAPVSLFLLAVAIVFILSVRRIIPAAIVTRGAGGRQLNVMTTPQNIPATPDITPQKSHDALSAQPQEQPQGEYWDRLRKLKRVKIITHPQSGVILSQKPPVGEEK